MAEDVRTRTSSERGSDGSTLDGDDTRTRILREAGFLFSRRGYDRVSTRDIAAACDIRQPTIYWYFETKRAIMAELIDIDVNRVIETLKWLSKSNISPAAQLYRFLSIDMALLIDDPYNLVGIFDTDVIEHPDFTEQGKRLQKVYQFYRRVLTSGMDQGQLVRTPLPVMREFIVGVDMHSGRMARSVKLPRGVDVPTALASMVLRGILVDPSEVEQIAAEALTLEVPAKLAELIGDAGSGGR